jgi:hypothetical protein
MMPTLFSGTAPGAVRGGILADPRRLIDRVEERLAARALDGALYATAAGDLAAASAVLLLLGWSAGEACLILNKRSERVRQPGDLCCPGGSVSPAVDAALARALRLPFSPLGRWRGWRRLRRERPVDSRWMALFLATGMREAFEEMRLNPLRLKVLGPLPAHRLVLFRRVIFPLAAWVPETIRFRPNWEVRAIVRIPLARLLDPAGYVRYRLRMPWRPAHDRQEAGAAEGDYPGFRFPSPGGEEILWGATYRIVERFLEEVFGFTPPEAALRPSVLGGLSGDYLTGRSC